MSAAPLTPVAGVDSGKVGQALRGWLLVLLAIGLLGTAVDLVLLDHYEDVWQMPPLLLTAGSLLIVSWVRLAGGRAAVLTLRRPRSWRSTPSSP